MKLTTYSVEADVFKAKCLNLMDQVNEQQISITITRHGKAIARLVPINDSPKDFFGCLKNKITINADIVNG